MIRSISSNNELNNYYESSQTRKVENRFIWHKDSNISSTSSTKPTSASPVENPQNYDLLIRFKPGSSSFQQQSLMTEMPMRNMQKFSFMPNLVSVTVRSNESVDELLKRIRGNPNVESAELDQ